MRSNQLSYPAITFPPLLGKSGAKVQVFFYSCNFFLTFLLPSLDILYEGH